MNTPNLDNWFGERTGEPVSLENVRIQTQFPRAPADVRPLLDAFAECEGYRPRSKTVYSCWLKGAKAFAAEFADERNQVELLKRVYRKMRNANLDISSPSSLITLARRVRRSNAALSDNGVFLCPECMTYHSKEDGCE